MDEGALSYVDGLWPDEAFDDDDWNLLDEAVQYEASKLSPVSTAKESISTVIMSPPSKFLNSQPQWVALNAVNEHSLPPSSVLYEFTQFSDGNSDCSNAQYFQETSAEMLPDLELSQLLNEVDIKQKQPMAAQSTFEEFAESLPSLTLLQSPQTATLDEKYIFAQCLDSPDMPTIPEIFESFVEAKAAEDVLQSLPSPARSTEYSEIKQDIADKKHLRSDSRDSTAFPQKRKKKAAHNIWPEKPKKDEKKPRVRTLDPTQPKISTYMPKQSKQSDPMLKYDQEGKLNPFVRSPIGPLVTTSSAIAGLGTGTTVKTCFRVGEALQVGMKRKTGSDEILIELYARVSFSERVGIKQNFQFLDLFHDRPPFLSGFFEFWKRCDLWNTDSSIFLGDSGKGRLARVVGRIIKRDAKQGGTGFILAILMIWEANWDDVEEMRDIIGV